MLKVQDRERLTVPRSHPEILFEISGPGEIVATDNGDPTDFNLFQSHRLKAFNGMALSILKTKKEAKGSFTITATGDGLKHGGISIHVRAGK